MGRTLLALPPMPTGNGPLRPRESSRPAYRNYRTLRRWFPRMAGLYVLGGLLAAAAPGFEVFPVFCWFLFPIVPGAEPRMELVVSELGGEDVNPPVDYQQTGWAKDPMAMDLWLATQALGSAVLKEDALAVRRLRRMIEANFVCAPSTYHIDEVEFDPLERYHTHTVRRRRTLATFTSTTGCSESPWPAR